MAVSGTRKDPLEALLRQDAPGSAKAAMTEQVLCALADTVVMCAKQEGCPCGRGLRSGFVSAIRAYRAQLGGSVATDAAGGIFSF